MSVQSTQSKLEGESPSGLPLLYKLPSVLDIARHAQASISTKTDFSFVKSTNSIPINAIEFIEAVKTYPIVFTNDENPLPVAIVGLERENYFIKPDNHWKESAYIPAYVRQYPFIFFERSEEKKFYLCVDEAAPQFSATQTENNTSLYTKDGKPTSLTNNALKFCTAFYQQHLITRNFCADLKEHKLLQTYQSEVTLASGKKTKLSGFQMIDEKALNSLPDKVYLSFRKKGWLPFIYFSLASTSNWKSIAELEAKLTA
jgi:hypothetical protein